MAVTDSRRLLPDPLTTVPGQGTPSSLACSFLANLTAGSSSLSLSLSSMAAAGGLLRSCRQLVPCKTEALLAGGLGSGVSGTAELWLESLPTKPCFAFSPSGPAPVEVSLCGEGFACMSSWQPVEGSFVAFMRSARLTTGLPVTDIKPFRGPDPGGAEAGLLGIGGTALEVAARSSSRRSSPRSLLSLSALGPSVCGSAAVAGAAAAFLRLRGASFAGNSFASWLSSSPLWPSALLSRVHDLNAH